LFAEGIIKDSWWQMELVIIFKINDNVIRYGELKRAIPSIREKMLIQELKMLVENKLVSKKAFSEIPPKVEYKLTDLGRKTLPIINKLIEFDLENLV
jgi:DNA-binding HxlR family transcriptional regulator